MAKANKVKLPNGSYVSLNDERFHIYRTLTGTAADTVSPYSHTKWDVTDSTITEYVDGMVVCLKVPVAGNGTYGTGLQINDLGYKPVVYNVNSMVSTRYGVGSIVWCVYNATQTGSLYINSTSAVTVTGCWQVQDYDANTNTIGYQLRTNSSTRPVSSATYRYRLMFSSLDNSQWVPANNSTSTNATSARTVNQEVINPWGRIVYYSTTAAKTAGQSLSATAQWDRYIFNLGYSFNDGSALDLTFPGPVYIKCAPQASGGAIIDSTTPYTQALPSSADGKIYIYLGQAYSASEVELIDYHPVFYHDGSKIAMWTDTKGFSGDYNDLTNKPTIPDAVSGVNDGTNWTSLTIGSTTKAIPQGGSSLPSQTGNSGKFLSTDGTDASWEELPVFDCILTYTEENGTTTASCNKTIGEIATAFSDKKLVVLRPTGSLRDDGSTPEDSKTPYICTFANNNAAVFVSSHASAGDLWLFSNLLPSDTPIKRDFVERNVILYSYGNNDTLQIPDGWHYKASVLARNKLTIQKNGTTLDVFNAGDTIDKIINIEVPEIDFTHTANTTISSSTTTVTFAANTRGSAMLTISADLGLTIACNNGSDNYIWVKNTGSSDVDITISGVTKNSTNVSNVYVPSDGISVPAGGLCEIGVIVNTDGAFLTSRNDLAL